MKKLRTVLILACLSVLLTNCAHYLGSADFTNDPSPDPNNPALQFSKDPALLPNQVLSDTMPAMMGILALLVIWLIYRNTIVSINRKKHISFDETEMAMLGLSIDTLTNLLRRLQTKAKAKVIPLWRRG